MLAILLSVLLQLLDECLLSLDPKLLSIVELERVLQLLLMLCQMLLQPIDEMYRHQVVRELSAQGMMLDL
jgi:hypothetical protein